MDSTQIQAEERLLYVSSSPHVFTEESTQRIMLDVVIAMVPAMIASVIFFGFHALAVILVSTLGAVAGEALMQKSRKMPLRIKDCSAVVTGILLAFNVPSTMPLWKICLAAIFSTAVVKELFGGLGQNFMNPALAGRAFLMASWPSDLSHMLEPMAGPDAIAGATPLSGGPNPALLDMFLGKMPGMLGEVSALAILIGACYLLWRGVIHLRIPLTMILSFLGFTSLFLLIDGSFDLTLLVQQLLSGGLILGAFFMATDYTTSPMAPLGQTLFALGAGFMTALIRQYGSLPEGVSYAILLMNVCTPLIDKYIKVKPFGGVAK